jgi:drug/metabolite transporter (DMT)-like permease
LTAPPLDARLQDPPHAGVLAPGDVAWMTLVALLWAICFPFIVIGLPDAPPLLFAALRALLAGVLLLAWAMCLRSQRPVRLKPADLVSLGFIGLSFTAMGFGGMFLGAGQLSPGLATVLASTQPLIAAVMAAVFLGEVLRIRVVLGLLTGFCGVLVLSVPGLGDGNPGYLSGVAWVMVAAIGTAAGNVWLKRMAGGPALLPMAVQLLIGALLLLLASVLAGETWQVQWTSGFTGSLLALSVLATAWMIVLWYRLLARAPLNRLNVFTFLTPAFGLGIGYLFFDERMSPFQLSGIAVILIGIAVMQLPAAADRRRA